MLSTKIRLRLEAIARQIVEGNEVSLSDMIWADKLAKANRSAYEILRSARRQALTGDVPEGGLDDFLNKMGLGDPDPSNHRTSFGGADDIVEWFGSDRTDDWRQRD